MISPFLLSELKQILRDDYQIEVSNKEIQVIGQDLVDFFDLLTQLNTRQKESSYGSTKDAS